MTDFGNWVRAKRQLNHITREQLAKKSGYSKSQLFRIETGQTSPALNTAENLATSFNMTLITALEEAAIIKRLTKESKI